MCFTTIAMHLNGRKFKKSKESVVYQVLYSIAPGIPLFSLFLEIFTHQHFLLYVKLI